MLSRPLRAHDLLAALGVAGIVVLTYGLRATQGLQSVPGDLGDARFNSIVLEHVYRWLTGQEALLWSPRFFYPFEGTLAFSDNHFGSILPYVLARYLGLEREMAFNAWFLTGLALNGATAYLVSRKLGLNGIGALVCSIVFSMSLPVIAQDGHVQLTYRFATPLACLAYFRLRDHPSAHGLAWLLIWWSLQFFCSIYIGVFLTLLLGALAAIEWRGAQTRALWAALVTRPSPHALRRYSGWVMLAIAGSMVALLLWMLAEYSLTARLYQFRRSYREISSMLPRLGSYLLADRSTLTGWVGGWIEGIPMRHEHQLFIGLGMAALVVSGLRKSGDRTPPPWLRPLSRATLLLALLTLMVGSFSLYKVLMGVPGFNSVRAVSRIILVMVWPLGLLAGWGAMRWLQRAGTPPLARLAMSVAILTLCSAEALTSSVIATPASTWRAQQAALAQQLKTELPRDAIVVGYLSPGQDWVISELDAVIFAQDRGLATVNGYSGNAPPGYVQMWPCLAADFRLLQFARQRALDSAELQRMRERVVTLNASPCPDGPLGTRSGPLGDDVAKTIRLELSRLQVIGRQITATVSIHNMGSEPLRTLSESGHMVNLGWRFATPAGGTPKWGQRQSLALDIPPARSRTVTFQTSMPESCVPCTIEISMVQEGLFWFHDRGMSIVSRPLRD